MYLNIQDKNGRGSACLNIAYAGVECSKSRSIFSHKEPERTITTIFRNKFWFPRFRSLSIKLLL